MYVEGVETRDIQIFTHNFLNIQHLNGQCLLCNRVTVYYPSISIIYKAS